MKEEQVILVDENDNELGSMEKMTAHTQGLCHRAFSVFILNADKNILLQKRHEDKYHCGSLWTNTCCGHPRPTENTEAAAKRRLYEETGIRTNLHYINKFHYTAPFHNGLTENEIDHVFYGNVTRNDYLINPEEIEETKWISLPHLSFLLARFPGQFTPWLKPALTIFQTVLHH